MIDFGRVGAPLPMRREDLSYQPTDRSSAAHNFALHRPTVRQEVEIASDDA
jgi:hypothetical protein